MRIHTKLEYQWDDTRSEYVLIHEEGYDLPDGSPIALCKGASDAQMDLAKSQKDFADALHNDYNTQFANQSAILGSLNKTLQPIVEAGIGQYGFTNAEDAAMRTQASAGTSATYNAAKRAAGQNMAAAGGGNEFLPTGAKAQTAAQIAQAAAQKESDQQLGITQAGYQQGRQNFANAVAAQQGVASQYNPLGYASGVTSANQSAYNMDEKNNELNNAASPWNAVGGILGGVAGSFLGPIGASIGSKIGTSIAGGATGGWGSMMVVPARHTIPRVIWVKVINDN